VLDALHQDGWVVTSAKQQRARSFDKLMHTKHSLALWHPELPDHKEGRPQIHLGNASDGSYAFRAIGGFLRFACLNQLYAGVKVCGGVFHHRGVDLENRIVAGFRDIRNNFGKVLSKVDSWTDIELVPEQQYEFARAAVASRWSNNAPIEINLENLLAARRSADQGASLWHTFNRVQESVIRGGFYAGFALRDENGEVIGIRNRRVRRVTSLTANERINTELWNLAESFDKNLSFEEAI
jgi:hypothetical protein